MIQSISTKVKTPTEEFYSKYFLFSYSSLNKLINSPSLFYNWYILRAREDTYEGHLVEGKVIHCLLLEKHMFHSSFTIMPGQIPGVSNKKIAEAMYKIWKEEKLVNDLPDYKDQILQWLRDNNLHQSLSDDKDLQKENSKSADSKRLEKVLTKDTIDYFNYLKKSGNKQVIDQSVLERCQKAIYSVQSNRTVTDLLRLNVTGFELLEVYNESKLVCQLQGLPFGLQGIVDNYVIDHTNKKVYINDLKTTSKTLSEFKDSVEYYNYWMQSSIYERLIKSHHPETHEYQYVFHFVVIDKFNQVYPFPVKRQTMLDWQSQLDKALEVAKYHYINKDYTLPYEFATGQVTL